ncbi:MAG: hypothetical protein ACI92I_000915 [Acidimicrobiales bacterium]|jgi:hypothetical protein
MIRIELKESNNRPYSHSLMYGMLEKKFKKIRVFMLKNIPKILLSISVGILVCIPMEKAAAVETPELDSLVAQVSALSKYIERNFISHENTVLSADELRLIVKEGTDWLINAQEDDGRFAYEYVPYEDMYLDDDHVVRQSGSLYELGEIARRDSAGVMNVSDAIKNSVGYLESLTEEVEYNDNTFRCITDSEKSSRCQLGATSLALLGILGYVEGGQKKSSQYESLIEEYLNYIMAMKKRDEGFKGYYITNRSSQSDKESSFSNGEALLALVRYYQYNPREDVKTMIDDTFTYLEGKEFETPLYLWIMAALKDMQELWPDERYVTYAQEFTNTRRGSLTRLHYTQKNYCATTEGLASAYNVLKGNVSESELSLLRQEIDFWNVHNSVLQILPVDKYRFVFEGSAFVMQMLQDVEQAQGGFLTSTSVLTQRIDYTQHCVSAYLQTLVDIEGNEL